ncbi:MAG: methyltransferase [Sphingomonas sp.]|jgi:predicted methyltransferase|uniref:class I SAM-dependent methyltransferase n=1 Tax=Sphingomonas sp. TaxID=28214 RepID=UPI0035635434
MRVALTGVAIVALMATAAVAKDHPAAETKKAVSAALADPARADQAVDDARRKAAETLIFAGVGPGDTVIDYLPGKGYWTRIFTGVVGAKGHVYPMWPAVSAARATATVEDLKGRNLANVTPVVGPGDIPTSDKPVDIFWTVENYHDVANNGGEAALAAVNKGVFNLLKPGGTYIVVDHASAPGTGITTTKTLHRIDGAAVKAQVIAAGFKFVGESKALNNPADDHSLPVFDEKIRGHTDQFIYKFRKPG